jgi:hypothetical protein
MTRPETQSPILISCFDVTSSRNQNISRDNPAFRLVQQLQKYFSIIMLRAINHQFSLSVSNIPVLDVTGAAHSQRLPQAVGSRTCHKARE